MADCLVSLCRLASSAAASADTYVPREMYEEAQLYSPVTTDEHGRSHRPPRPRSPRRQRPRLPPPAQRDRRRRARVEARASRPRAIDYTDDEQEVWRTVCRELAPKHERYAVREYREAKARVATPDRPRPEPRRGLRARRAAHRLELRARRPASCRSTSSTARSRDRRFHSTQYVRHPGVPLYTPEPDIIHEVIGHGHLLATPTFGELHRLAGVAARRLTDDDNLLLPVARVLVLARVRRRRRGRRAARVWRRASSRATARSRSSAGWSTGRSTSSRWAPRTTTSPRTSRCSTGPSRSQEIVDVVGWFFATCDDESIAALAIA